jgi:hypothetical protein
MQLSGGQNGNSRGHGGRTSRGGHGGNLQRLGGIVEICKDGDSGYKILGSEKWHSKK